MYWSFPNNFFWEMENRIEEMGYRFWTIAHLDFLLQNSICIGKQGEIFFLLIISSSSPLSLRLEDTGAPGCLFHPGL